MNLDNVIGREVDRFPQDQDATAWNDDEYCVEWDESDAVDLVADHIESLHDLD